MPKLNHEVILTEEEIKHLKDITHKGSGKSARTIMHAHILLLSDDGDKKKNNREIAEIFDISPSTVNQVRQLYSNEGLDCALKRKTRISPPHISKITGVCHANGRCAGHIQKGV